MVRKQTGLVRSLTCITQVITGSIAVWVQHSTVDWDCAKTRTLLGTLKIRHQNRWECCVSSEVGSGVWFVVVCVAVAIPATVFLLCWCGPCRSCSRKISGQEWVAMVFKRSEGVRGSRRKSEQTQSWQVRSRLTGERSGFLNSAQSQMCGRGGVVGVATMTSQQGCVGSAVRQSLQVPENAQHASRRRAERRMESPEVRRKEIRSFGPGLRLCKRRKGERTQ